MFFGLSWKENQVSSSFGDLIPVAIGNNLPILIASKCWNHGNLEFHFHSPRDCCHRKDIKPIYAFLAVDSWFYLSFSNSKIWQLWYLTIAIAFTSFKHCGKIFSHHQVILEVRTNHPTFIHWWPQFYLTSLTVMCIILPIIQRQILSLSLILPEHDKKPNIVVIVYW